MKNEPTIEEVIAEMKGWYCPDESSATPYWQRWLTSLRAIAARHEQERQVLEEFMSATKALFDAPHYEHFCVRLNDEENEALDRLRALNDGSKSLFEQIHEWQLQTFPKASVRSKYVHLQKEIGELGEKTDDPSEIADCMMLLIGMAMIQGFDPMAELRKKFEVNKTRNWGEPDEHGVVEHVRALGIGQGATGSSREEEVTG